MQTAIVEKHQVAGSDDRDRGFNRLTDIDLAEGGYRASLQYENTIIATDRRGTQVEALAELIRLLHDRGYSQLRSRVAFRGSTYLGSQEIWIEYPDPERPADKPGGPSSLLGRLRQTLGL
jgi:hypothetical protein